MLVGKHISLLLVLGCSCSIVIACGVFFLLAGVWLVVDVDNDVDFFVVVLLVTFDEILVSEKIVPCHDCEVFDYQFV